MLPAQSKNIKLSIENQAHVKKTMAEEIISWQLILDSWVSFAILLFLYNCVKTSSPGNLQHPVPEAEGLGKAFFQGHAWNL